MDITPAITKAKAYIDVETNWFRGKTAYLPHGEDGPYITISREAGSGGSIFAKALVQELNARRGPHSPEWTLFDSELVQQMLSEANLPSRLARFLPEDRIPAVVSAIGEIVGLHPDLWTLVRRTNETVRRLAALGHTVIVGRGGNYAAAGVANGLNLRLVGSPMGRARRVASIRGCTLSEAETHLRKIDSARRVYVKSAFDREVSDVSAYDIVLNTDTISVADGVSSVLTLLARRWLARAGC